MKRDAGAVAARCSLSSIHPVSDLPPSSSRETDRNLLFSVLALQLELIDKTQFVEACGAWAASKETPLADLLVSRGWLTPADRADVERHFERKLRKHQG